MLSMVVTLTMREPGIRFPVILPRPNKGTSMAVAEASIDPGTVPWPRKESQHRPSLYTFEILSLLLMTKCREKHFQRQKHLKNMF